MDSEFAAVCASSDEDELCVDQRKRNRILCDKCKEMVSKSPYYGSHQYGLCTRATSEDQSSEDECIYDDLQCEDEISAMDLDCYGDGGSNLDPTIVESQAQCIQVNYSSLVSLA